MNTDVQQSPFTGITIFCSSNRCRPKHDISKQKKKKPLETPCFVRKTGILTTEQRYFETDYRSCRRQFKALRAGSSASLPWMHRSPFRTRLPKTRTKQRATGVMLQTDGDCQIAKRVRGVQMKVRQRHAGIVDGLDCHQYAENLDTAGLQNLRAGTGESEVSSLSIWIRGGAV